jgi:uncharacterized protein with FMN-binding domain
VKSSKKARSSGVGGNLMALGSAAVLAVYAAGYLRTKPAADQLAAQRSMRRPFPPTAAAQGAPARTSASSTAPSLGTSAGDSLAALSESESANASATLASATGLPAATAVMAAAPGSGGTTAPTNPASSPSPGAAVTRDSTVNLTPNVAQPAPAPNNMTPPVAVALPNVSQPVNVAAVVSAPPGGAPAGGAPAAVAPPVVAAPVAPVAAAPAPAAKPAAKAGYRDGLHYGRGTSRHGDIESLIEISNGRIISVVISQCLTQYTCRWISALPAQVIARQSPDVDYVTGATESANAFYFSIVQALMQAK